MPGKFRKFLALDRQRKKLLAQAYLQLGAVRTALLLKPFKKLVSGLDLHREAVSGPELIHAAREEARAIGWAIRSAACFTPWKSTCLVQVLAAQKMLEKRGIAGVFYIGASHNGADKGNPAFQAHAWLKCHDEFITGESGYEQFRVVSSFSWG